MKKVKGLLISVVLLTSLFASVAQADFIATPLGTNDSIVATIIHPIDAAGNALRFGVGNIVSGVTGKDTSYTLSAGYGFANGLAVDLSYAKDDVSGSNPTIGLTVLKGYTYSINDNLQLGVAIVLADISTTGGTTTTKLLKATLPVIVAKFTF